MPTFGVPQITLEGSRDKVGLRVSLICMNYNDSSFIVKQAEKLNPNWLPSFDHFVATFITQRHMNFCIFLGVRGLEGTHVNKFRLRWELQTSSLVHPARLKILTSL